MVVNLLVALKTAAATMVVNLLVALKTAAATMVVIRLAVLPPKVVAVCLNVSSTASPLVVAVMMLAIAPVTMDAKLPAVVSLLVALPLWNPLPSFSLLPQLKNRPHVELILPPSERVKLPFDEQAT